MKNKIIIIPDIHGRDFWKSALDDIKNGVRTIFLGDYHDPYKHENISKQDSINNFKEIIEIANKYSNVELLLGNHDFGYIHPEICSSRRDYENYEVISKLFEDNKHLFKICTIYKDVLISHAGVHQDWLIEVFYPEIETVEDVIKIPLDKIHDDINKLLEDEEHLVESLNVVGMSRGGRGLYGSPVWCDISEHWNNDLPFKQIVGHSMQCHGFYDDNFRVHYKWGLPIQYGEYDQVTCIDCYRIFELNEDELGIELTIYNSNEYLAIL